MANILVVDDEMGIRELLSEILSDEGHVVQTAENAQQAREARAAETPDLVLLDIWMPDTDGVTLLKEWQRDGYLTMPVIMMSGHATIDTDVEVVESLALLHGLCGKRYCCKRSSNQCKNFFHILFFKFVYIVSSYSISHAVASCGNLVPSVTGTRMPCLCGACVGRSECCQPFLCAAKVCKKLFTPKCFCRNSDFGI